jgi:hypothetical protein
MEAALIVAHLARWTDMQVTNGEALLEKYGLKPNDAVLAEGKQTEMSVYACSHSRKVQEGD